MNNECMLCASKKLSARHPYVRDNKEIQVLECQDCGLVFLSTFEHISDIFYENSGMLNGAVNLSEYRNRSYKDDLRRATALNEKILNKRVLDFGCGAGGFLNLISDKVDLVAGVELDNYIRNAMNVEGMTCYANLSEIEGEYDVITLFHVLEHLTNPIETLQSLKKYLSVGGKLIVEVPNSEDALLTLYNSEKFADFTYWSCHTYLYNHFTLKKMVESAGFKVKMVKQIQRYTLGNHLYWLSEGKPGGHSHLALLDNDLLNSAYESTLASLGKCDTIILEATI